MAQSYSSCSTTHQVGHQEFSSSLLQGIKQAWTQSIRIIRGSACVPVGCVYTLGQTLCLPKYLNVSLIITINRMHESTRHLTTEEIIAIIDDLLDDLADEFRDLTDAELAELLLELTELELELLFDPLTFEEILSRRVRGSMGT
jgi:hypothetical protein